MNSIFIEKFIWKPQLILKLILLSLSVVPETINTYSVNILFYVSSSREVKVKQKTPRFFKYIYLHSTLLIIIDKSLYFLNNRLCDKNIKQSVLSALRVRIWAMDKMGFMTELRTLLLRLEELINKHHWSKFNSMTLSRK